MRVSNRDGIKFTQIAWTIDAECFLQEALEGDRDFIRYEVQLGKAALFHVSGNAEGYLVLRLENYRDFNELVLVAGAGEGGDRVIRALQKMVAETPSIRSIRVHARPRKANARYYRDRLGFQESETVYTWEPK